MPELERLARADPRDDRPRRPRRRPLLTVAQADGPNLIAVGDWTGPAASRSTASPRGKVLLASLAEREVLRIVRRGLVTLHGADDHRARAAARGAGPDPPARLRDGDRRVRARAQRGRGAGPRRARQRDRRRRHLGPGVPAHAAARPGARGAGPRGRGGHLRPARRRTPPDRGRAASAACPTPVDRDLRDAATSSADRSSSTDRRLGSDPILPIAADHHRRARRCVWLARIFVHGIVKALLDREATEGTAQELSARSSSRSGWTRSTTLGAQRHPGRSSWRSPVLMILGELGFDIGPAIAGLGVVGIAVGFGAQSLVRDYLNGALILIENQFSQGRRRPDRRGGGHGRGLQPAADDAARPRRGRPHRAQRRDQGRLEPDPRLGPDQPGRDGRLRHGHRQGDRGRRRGRAGDGRRPDLAAARPRGAARRAGRGHRRVRHHAQGPGHRSAPAEQWAPPASSASGCSPRSRRNGIEIPRPQRVVLAASRAPDPYPADGAEPGGRRQDDRRPGRTRGARDAAGADPGRAAATVGQPATRTGRMARPAAGGPT